jgi:predicted nucleotidyltransferase/DNA-binding XRE family transcriptional regulator
LPVSIKFLGSCRFSPRQSTIRYIVSMARSSTAGALLRRARRHSGLSQAELAVRAGTTQSVISVYESGRRQPSLPTLMSLVEATGLHLNVELSDGSGRVPAGRPASSLALRVRDNAARIRDAATESGVTVLGLFGSAARGEDGPDSDVDLLIDVPDGVGLFALGRLETELRELLGAPVDLVPLSGLKPHVRREVLAEVQPL